MEEKEKNEKTPLLQDKKKKEKEKDERDKEKVKEKDKEKDKSKEKEKEKEKDKSKDKEEEQGSSKDKGKHKEDEDGKHKDKDEGRGKKKHKRGVGGLHDLLGTETVRPRDLDFDISVFCCCNTDDRRGGEEGGTHLTDEIHHQSLHQRYLVHVLCTIIMGADVTLDIMQVACYGKYGAKTHDLFVASLFIMSIVPAGLSIALAFYASHLVLRMIYDFFIGKDTFGWGFFFGMFIWCIGTLLIPIVVCAFVITAFLAFPFMALAVIITPAYGLYVAWKNIYAERQYRLYYFIRYSQGLVCAFPHFIIDVVFMHRMGYHSAQAVASAIFSALSVCQVAYQAFGLKRIICRCKKKTCVSLDGYGTLKDIIKGRSRIVEPKCNCCK